MKSNNTRPSRGSLAREKLQRSIRFALVSSGLSLALLAPTFAEANLFSIPDLLRGLIPSSSAKGASQNSQTLQLLAAARNIDPTPAVGGGDIELVGGAALLSEEGPNGTTADVDQAPPEASMISVYTVHKGDTLSSIAKMFGVTSNTIVWANNLTGPIHEGDQLVILPIAGVRYSARAGDTLSSIAKKYKADAGEIAQYNDLSSGETLAAGQVIIIPNGEAPLTQAQIAANAHQKSINKIKKGGTEPYLGGSGPDYGGYYSWPVAGGIVTQRLHGWNGVDIGAPTGTAVYAAAAGTVIVARSGGWNGGYGNYIVVSHPNGTQTLYAHLSRVLVSPGEAVAQGTTIGKVGATGLSTGAHLHFEVRGAMNPYAN